jgi:hypothetical protein
MATAAVVGQAADEAAPWPVKVTQEWTTLVPRLSGMQVSADGRYVLATAGHDYGDMMIVCLNDAGKELWRHPSTAGRMRLGGIANDGALGAGTEFWLDRDNGIIHSTVAVFTMTDGRALATKSFAFPYPKDQADDLLVPEASISPDGRFLLCADPINRFVEMYEIKSGDLALLWSGKGVLPKLPANDAGAYTEWLPDGAGILVSTEQGVYDQITRGGVRGWRITGPSDGGHALSASPIGRGGPLGLRVPSPSGGAYGLSLSPPEPLLTIWGNTFLEEWPYNPVPIAPDSGTYRGLEAEGSSLTFYEVGHEPYESLPPVVRTLRGLSWSGGDWGRLRRVEAIKDGLSVLAVLFFEKQTMLVRLPCSTDEIQNPAVSTIVSMETVTDIDAARVAWASSRSLFGVLTRVPRRPTVAEERGRLSFYDYSGTQLWTGELPKPPLSAGQTLYLSPDGRVVYVATYGSVTRFTVDDHRP